MEFDPKIIDNKIKDNSDLAKEFFLNMISAHGMDEMNNLIEKIEDAQWLKIFKREKSWIVDGNIFNNNNPVLVRGDVIEKGLIEVDFGNLSFVNNQFFLKLNNVKDSVKVIKNNDVIYESNDNSEIVLDIGIYVLEIDNKKYLLDLES